MEYVLWEASCVTDPSAHRGEVCLTATLDGEQIWPVGRPLSPTDMETGMWLDERTPPEGYVRHVILYRGDALPSEEQPQIEDLTSAVLSSMGYTISGAFNADDTFAYNYWSPYWPGTERTYRFHCTEPDGIQLAWATDLEGTTSDADVLLNDKIAAFLSYNVHRILESVGLPFHGIRCFVSAQHRTVIYDIQPTPQMSDLLHVISVDEL